MLGWEYTRGFWASNWYLPVIFIAIMAILNAYFISNWKLFTLLEREDWKSILSYTYDKLNSGKIKKQYIKIFINAALVNSDLESIKKVKELVWEKRPSWKEEFVLYFGLPYLLENEPAEMIGYYKDFLEIKTNERQWVLWNYAFAQMLSKKFDEAKIQLKELGEIAEDPLVLALTGYMVNGFSAAEDQDMKTLENKIKTSLLEKYPREKWKAAVEKSREHVQAAVLSKLIIDAENWLYS